MQLRRIQIAAPVLQTPVRRLTRRQWFKILIYTGIIIPIIALGTAVYLIWFSPYFVVDYVEITGANGLDMTSVRRVIFQQMEQYRYRIFPQRNIWFFDIDAARHAIWEEYAISQLSIEKKAPNTININVFEEPFQAIWYSKGKYYKIDGRGIVIKEVDADLLGTIPYALPSADPSGAIPPLPPAPPKEQRKAPTLLYIQDLNNADATPGMTVLPSRAIEVIGHIREKLSPFQISVYYITAKSKDHDIEVVTTEGWKIQLNVFEHVDEQIEHLRIALQQKIKNDRAKLDYIDVRFDNRIYIKNK